MNNMYMYQDNYYTPAPIQEQEFYMPQEMNDNDRFLGIGFGLPYGMPYLGLGYGYPWFGFPYFRRFGWGWHGRPWFGRW